MTLNIVGTNAFYYYKDLATAWSFYQDVLGMETIHDFGDAKMLRLARDSYLTLVDVAHGMHSGEEPKSVTTAFVTDQVEGWWDYLQSVNVPIERPYTTKANSAHDGFVALDPEGYFLEFELFKPHQENEYILPALRDIKHTFTEIGQRPSHLGIQATVQWLYYDELPPMERFYESLLGVTQMVDQGWAKVYQIAGSGFIGLVDGKEGLHPVSQEKCVTLSFLTDDVDGWLKRAKGIDGLRLRHEEVVEENGRVRLFVAIDPGGYYLEWDEIVWRTKSS